MLHVFWATLYLSELNTNLTITLTTIIIILHACTCKKYIWVKKTLDLSSVAEENYYGMHACIEKLFHFYYSYIMPSTCSMLSATSKRITRRCLRHSQM